MIKTLTAAEHEERMHFHIPRSVQQSIPIRHIYADGIWQVGDKYSKTWRFADVNYAVASEEEQAGMFLSYGSIINSLPTDATTKITINNRRVNPDDLQRSLFSGGSDDDLEDYRRECRAMLSDKIAESNHLVQDKYITVSTAKGSLEEARAFFRRVYGELGRSFGQLDSAATPLNNHDRLRIFHDFFRPGEEPYYHFSVEETIRKGHDFRDYIAPDGLRFKADHFDMGNKVGRVLFLREYASFLKDSMITDLSDFPRDLMISIDMVPVPTDEAVKEMQTKLLGIESDITRWQNRQNKHNNFTAALPYQLEQYRAEAKGLLDDLSSRDQRMIFAVVTLVHLADTQAQLDADTEALLSIGRKHLCQFAALRYQQEDGLNTVLPYGLRRIKALRTMNTESAAVLMPFRVQEIQDVGGLYCGVNAISHNLLVCDRKKLLNPHGFCLGVSGGGKSMTLKEMIALLLLFTKDDVIVLDAEREYRRLCDAFHGQTIELSPGSPHHLNPLELTEGYGIDENPVAMKSELLMSICEQQMGVGQLGPYHKSIIDRCTAKVYRDFKKRGKGRQVLLSDWREELLRQPEREAQELALASELFVEGSLNIFAHETNVDLSNRLVTFDLYEMGEQLRPTALTVTMEAIQNRVAANRLAGRYTWVFIDEIYLFFRYVYSAEFLYKCWKRFRKYAAALTGATQNVEECLRSETARFMFANSEFLVLLNQAATGRAELSHLLNISQTQLGYITNAKAGHGLLRIGGSIVPFVNEIPSDTELYRLMTTKPNE